MLGGDGAFEEIGNRFLDHFIKYGKLKRTDAVLDVGCGSGRMALPLTKYLADSARYEGFDIDKNCIQWCQENITTRYPNFYVPACLHFQQILQPQRKNQT
jgi:ubiquinone/menaquinone biosynthesis C-methylase UbiE